MVAMPGEDEKKKGAGTSKRAHKRVDFFNPVKVVVPDENTAVDVFAGNVSKGGMFLRSNRPLPKGKKVKLEFETEEGKVEVEEGEVVWNKEFEPISIDGSPAGMGVEFKSMSEDSKLKIEAFIDDALHAQPQEEEPAPPPAAEPPPPPQPEPAPAEAAPAAEPMRMKLDMVSPEPAPAPEPEQSAPPEEKPPPTEGGEEVMATAPPRRRTKMMLFGGFVLLVAAVTFLTLLFIKPPGDKTEPEVTKPPAPEKPTPPEAPKKPEPVAEKKPEPVAEKKPEPVPEKPREKPGRQTPPKPEPIAEKKPEPAPPDAIQGLQVGPPVFAEKDGEWRMIITATGPVKIKHFTLKNPPRLAVDFKGAVYSGKSRTQESPAPSVARVRVGEQPEFTRFVLDFDGSEVPQHRIVKKEDRVVIFFGR